MTSAVVVGAILCHAEVPPATLPATAPAGALSVGPLTYFEEHCARCHGPWGSGYLPESLGRHDAAELRRIIREMASGPAQSPLAESDLDAQVDFHLSTRSRSPFIAIVENTENRISGEATPGATLRLEAGGKVADIPLDGHAWSVHIGGIDSASLADAKIIATKGDRRATLRLDRPFSSADGGE